MLDRYKPKPVPIKENKKHKQEIIPIVHPLRILNQFPLIDDFYSNIITYCDKDLLFCVDNVVFSHNWLKNRTCRYTIFPNETVNSLSAHNEMLVCGAIEGFLNIFDMCNNTNKTYKMHKSRIGCLDHYRDLVFTGSRDRFVKVLDLRVKKEVLCVSAHTQEICGIKVNKDCTLLASGGNDNKLVLYDMRMFDAPMKFTDHVAAVKAISWDTATDKLVSGGGTACRTMKLWDMKRRRIIKSIDTGSQVCGLYWGHDNKIVSTHGYSQNEVRMWNPDFSSKRIFRMHKNRVLHFAVSKDESIFCTGSSENELYFWDYHDYERSNHR